MAQVRENQQSDAIRTNRARKGAAGLRRMWPRNRQNRFALPQQKVSLRFGSMPSLTLKPTHKAVTAYYASLAKFAKLGIKHETAVRSAFQELLEHCARQFDWKLVPEYRIKRKGQADASSSNFTRSALLRIEMIGFMVSARRKSPRKFNG